MLPTGNQEAVKKIICLVLKVTRAWVFKAKCILKGAEQTRRQKKDYQSPLTLHAWACRANKLDMLMSANTMLNIAPNPGRFPLVLVQLLVMDLRPTSSQSGDDKGLEINGGSV